MWKTFPHFSHGYRIRTIVSVCNSHSISTQEASDSLFNSVAGPGDYGRQAHNTQALFPSAVQMFIGTVLQRNCCVHRLLACRLGHGSESVDCEMTRVACVPTAGPVEGFAAVSQTTFLYRIQRRFKKQSIPEFGKPQNNTYALTEKGVDNNRQEYVNESIVW
jgi:hypothetical protein